MGGRGKATEHTEETAYAVTSLWEDQADATRLLQRVRDNWQIENGQYYRRDRTQQEDHCTVRETNSAWVPSLFRSLVIYLYEAQRGRRGGWWAATANTVRQWRMTNGQWRR